MSALGPFPWRSQRSAQDEGVAAFEAPSRPKQARTAARKAEVLL